MNWPYNSLILPYYRDSSPLFLPVPNFGRLSDLYNILPYSAFQSSILHTLLSSSLIYYKTQPSEVSQEPVMSSGVLAFDPILLNTMLDRGCYGTTCLQLAALTLATLLYHNLHNLLLFDTFILNSLNLIGHRTLKWDIYQPNGLMYDHLHFSYSSPRATFYPVAEISLLEYLP